MSSLRSKGPSKHFLYTVDRPRSERSPWNRTYGYSVVVEEGLRSLRYVAMSGGCKNLDF